MPDDCLDARRGKFSDERGEDVVAQADRGEGTDGIHDSGGQVWHHASDEHDDEALAAAVVIDLCEKGALRDRLFCRIAEVEAHQHEGNRYADGLCDTGQNDAGDNAE